jgi:phosphatidylserine/phosphatidylglycerophosphate/cardiolipin synthase-like enzyme
MVSANCLDCYFPIWCRVMPPKSWIGRGNRSRLHLAYPARTNAIQELITAGCSVHLIPDDNEHLYMHEKILLVDDITLIIGSQNLSTASLLENRELSLKLDAEIA